MSEKEKAFFDDLNEHLQQISPDMKARPLKEVLEDQATPDSTREIAYQFIKLKEYFAETGATEWNEADFNKWLSTQTS